MGGLAALVDSGNDLRKDLRVWHGEDDSVAPAVMEMGWNFVRNGDCTQQSEFFINSGMTPESCGAACLEAGSNLFSWALEMYGGQCYCEELYTSPLPGEEC